MSGGWQRLKSSLASNDRPWTLRPGTQQDLAFVVESWLLSFRDKARARTCGDLYMREYKAKIRELLKRADLLVACDVDDPWFIVGFAVTSVGHDETHRVHYVFVRKECRREGIARSLLGDLLDTGGVHYSHVSHQVNAPAAWVYNPIADDRLLWEQAAREER